MSRRHFCQEIMTGVCGEVMNRLKRILQRAKCVIIMQYMLTERDVAFFTSLMGIDLYAPSIYSVNFRYSNRPPLYMEYSKNKNRVVHELVKYLSRHGGVKPVAVFCSSVGKSSAIGCPWPWPWTCT